MKHKQLREIIGDKYSLNHLDSVAIKSPESLDDEAVVKVTLKYASEGLDKGQFTIELPVVRIDVQV